MTNQDQINKQWTIIEHDIRYFVFIKKKLNEEDWINVDILKSAIIALLGHKMFNDNNEIFYQNMIYDAKNSIKYLSNKFPEERHKLENIEKFIINNL